MTGDVLDDTARLLSGYALQSVVLHRIYLISGWW